MRKKIQWLISWILSLAIVISLTPGAYAISANDEISFSTDISISEDDYASFVYQSLSEQAKQIFLKQIASDSQLSTYHRENVDPSFDPQAIPAIYATYDELSIVQNGLAAMNLSLSVKYALEGVASEIIAAGGIALTAPQLYILLVGTSIAVVLAENWDEVSSLFSQIIAVFQDAFSYMHSNIKSAMDDIGSDAESIQSKPKLTSVGVSSNGLVILKKQDGTTEQYRCSVGAESFYPDEGSPYYIAALVGPVGSKRLWVCPINVNQGIAIAIRICNNPSVGILTPYNNLAYKLAALGGAIPSHHSNESHSFDPNYLPHWHPMRPNGSTEGTIHIWHF